MVNKIMQCLKKIMANFVCVYSFCRQEGWRLEHEDPRDPNSPIVFKGVVFNEMKGVFVSSSNHI